MNRLSSQSPLLDEFSSGDDVGGDGRHEKKRTTVQFKDAFEETVWRFLSIDERHNVAKRIKPDPAKDGFINQTFRPVKIDTLARDLKTQEYHSGAEMSKSWVEGWLGVAVGRSLVLDSDSLVITYDDPRLCGAVGLSMRWRLQLTGARLALALLEEEFGYSKENALVCHSGGRGVHVHVPAASNLSDAARSSVTDMFMWEGRTLSEYANVLKHTRLVSMGSPTARDAVNMMQELVASKSPAGLDLFADARRREETESFVLGSPSPAVAALVADSGSPWFSALADTVSERGDDMNTRARFMAWVLSTVGFINDRGVSRSMTHLVRTPLSPGKTGEFRSTPLPHACMEHPATLPPWAPLRVRGPVVDRDHPAVIAVVRHAVGLRRGVHNRAKSDAATALLTLGEPPPLEDSVAAKIQRSIDRSTETVTSSRRVRERPIQANVSTVLLDGLRTEEERRLIMEAHCYDMVPSCRWPKSVVDILTGPRPWSPESRNMTLIGLITNGVPPSVFSRFVISSRGTASAICNHGGLDDISGKLRRLVPHLSTKFCYRTHTKMDFTPSEALIKECQTAAEVIENAM